MNGLNTDWKTRVLVHVFTEAVDRADEYILTFVTFMTGHTSASFHTETNF